LASLNNLALLLEDRERPEEAEPLYRRALQGREAKLGCEHPDTLASLCNLVGLLEDRGESKEAEELLRRRPASPPASPQGNGALLAGIPAHDLTEPPWAPGAAATEAEEIVAFLCGRLSPGAAAAAVAAEEQLLPSPEVGRDTLLRREAREMPSKRALLKVDNLAALFCAQQKIAEETPILATPRKRRASGGLQAASDHGVEAEEPLLVLGRALQGRALPQGKGLRRRVKTEERLVVSPSREVSVPHDRALTDNDQPDSDALRRMNDFACTLLEHGELDEAETLLECLGPAEPASSSRELATPHPEALRRVDDLVAAAYSLDQPQDAEVKPHPDALRRADALAALLYAKGELEDADELLAAFVPGDTCGGGTGSEQEAQAMSYSELLRRMRRLAHEGRFEEAEPLYRRALRLNEATLGPMHPDTLDFVSDLAVLLQARNKHDEAERLYGRAVRGRDTRLGPQHPRTLESVSNLAWLLEARGKLVEAEPLYRRAFEGFEASVGSDHPDTLGSLYNLAMLLKSLGKLDEAESLFQRELEGCSQVYGPAHEDTIWSACHLEELLRGRGKESEADGVACQVLHESGSFSV